MYLLWVLCHVLNTLATFMTKQLIIGYTIFITSSLEFTSLARLWDCWKKPENLEETRTDNGRTNCT